ncbi:hypothetical protein HK098_004873 [Nowakowskiella sp. JEL0407]|nr:hypothetical protein HK098_004873 [Nowakowskiella sp. JEL0407]
MDPNQNSNWDLLSSAPQELQPSFQNLQKEHIQPPITAANALSDDVCTGGPLSFCCLPGLEVSEIGSISLPLSTAQTQQLITQAIPTKLNEKLSPYSTLTTQKQLSPSKSFKLPSKSFQIWNAEWESLVMTPLLNSIKEKFGLVKSDDGDSYGNLVLEPSKLLITVPASYSSQTTSEDDIEEDLDDDIGSFATLIIVLPSKYESGEIVVVEHIEAMNEFAAADPLNQSLQRHRAPSIIKKEVEHVFDFSPRSAHGFHYAVFLKECPVTIRPVSDGVRLCLVYNLMFRPPAALNPMSSIGATKLSEEEGSSIIVAGTVDAIEKWTQPIYASKGRVFNVLKCSYQSAASIMSLNDSIGGSKVIPPPSNVLNLDHSQNFQSEVLYPLSSPASLSKNAVQSEPHLKTILRRMCDDTGLDVFIANVTLRVRGDAHSKWYHGNNIFEMGSERIRDATLDGWIKVNNAGENGSTSMQDLGVVEIDVSDLSPENIVLELEKEWCDDETVQPTGWNEGTAMLRIYRRAAIILWRKQETYRILCRRNFPKLVTYFNKQVASDIEKNSGVLTTGSLDIAHGIFDFFSISKKGAANPRVGGVDEIEIKLKDAALSSSSDSFADEKTVLLLFDTFSIMNDKSLFSQFLARILPILLENARNNSVTYTQNLTIELLKRAIDATTSYGWESIHEFMVDTAKRSARHGDLEISVLMTKVISEKYVTEKSRPDANKALVLRIEKCFRAVANGIVALFDATRAPPPSSMHETITLESQLLELLDGFGYLSDLELDHRFATEFLPRVFDGPRGFPGIAFIDTLLKKDGTVVSRFGFETVQKVLVLLAQSTARSGKLADIKHLMKAIRTYEEGSLPDSENGQVTKFKYIAECVVNNFAAIRMGYVWSFNRELVEISDSVALPSKLEKPLSEQPSDTSEVETVEIMETFSNVEDNVIRRKFAVQMLPKIFAVSQGCPGPRLINILLDERGFVSQKLGPENLKRLVLLLAQNRSQAGKIADITKLLEVILTFRGAGGTANTETPLESVTPGTSTLDPVIKIVVETILSHLAACPRTELGAEIPLLEAFIAIGDKDFYEKFIVHVLPRLLLGGNGDERTLAEFPENGSVGLPSIELLSLLLKGTRRFGWESLHMMLATSVQRSLRRGMVENVTKFLEEIVGLCTPFLPPLPVHQAPPPSTNKLMRNSSVRSVATSNAYSVNDEFDDYYFDISTLLDEVTIDSETKQKKHPLLDIARDLGKLMVKSMIEDMEDPNPVKTAPVERNNLPVALTAAKQGSSCPPRLGSFVHAVFVILHRLKERETLKEWLHDDVLIKPLKYPLATAIVPSIYSLRAYLNPPPPTASTPMPKPPNAKDEDSNESNEGDNMAIPVAGPVSDACFIVLVRGAVELLINHPLLRSTGTYLLALQQQSQWDPNHPNPPPPIPFHPMIPPLNWRINRQIRCSRRCTDCKQLQAFLRHSAQVTARYALPHRRREHLQRELERAVIVSSGQGINTIPLGPNTFNANSNNFTTMSTATTVNDGNGQDVSEGPATSTQIGGIAAASQEFLGEVRVETIKEGTPHALVITKTRRVYEENWRAWARATVAALIGGGPAKIADNSNEKPQPNIGLFVPELLQLGSLVPSEFWRNQLQPTLPVPPQQSNLSRHDSVSSQASNLSRSDSYALARTDSYSLGRSDSQLLNRSESNTLARSDSYGLGRNESFRSRNGSLTTQSPNDNNFRSRNGSVTGTMHSPLSPTVYSNSGPLSPPISPQNNMNDPRQLLFLQQQQQQQQQLPFGGQSHSPTSYMNNSFSQTQSVSSQQQWQHHYNIPSNNNLHNQRRNSGFNDGQSASSNLPHRTTLSVNTLQTITDGEELAPPPIEFPGQGQHGWR